jgi:hypothetical protein
MATAVAIFGNVQFEFASLPSKFATVGKLILSTKPMSPWRLWQDKK